MRRFGRFLQIIGLTLLPVGMILNLLRGPGGAPFLSVWQMLAAMVGGFCLFTIGRIVEGYAVKK